MKIQRNVIYADPAMNGYQLRNALREANLPTKFLSRTHQENTHARKVAPSEEEIYFRDLAESRGYAVDNVEATFDYVLIRTKF